MQPAGESIIQVKRRIIVVLIVLPLFSVFAAFLNILGIHDSRTPQLGRGEADRDRSVLGRCCCRARAADWLEVPQRLARQESRASDPIPWKPGVRRMS